MNNEQNNLFSLKLHENDILQLQENKVRTSNKDKLSRSCKLQLFGIYIVYIYPISPPIYIYIDIYRERERET